MFRAVLIAYLSVATAMSSSFCCCSMRQLFARSATASCCKAGVLRETSCPNCQQEESDNDTNAQAKLPCDGDRHCGCGIRQAKQIAPTTVVGETSPSWGWLDLHYPDLVEYTFDPLSLDGVTSRFRKKQRPAALYGRDILRAYQILRC